MNQWLDENLDSLTEQILASYETHKDLQRVGMTFLPSRSKIVEILDLTRQLLFPGFFGHKKLSAESVRYHVGNLISRLGEDLAEQINHCLCTEQAPGRGGRQQDCLKLAQKISSEFFGRVAALRAMLALDVQAAYDGDPAAKSTAEIIYSYPGFYAVVVYRIAHELLTLGVPLMPRIMSEHAHSATGCDIHPGAKIGKSFFIDHASGVVVGETTHIGDNVKIYQGVTLGAMSFPKDERGRVIKGLQRHPTIEDNVTIYANATILGGETVIGRNSTVGGNTFVTSSVPPDSIVMQGAAQLEVKSKRKGPHKG